MAGVLHGHAAVVTGASRGIGRAVAYELAHLGARVLLTYRVNRQAAEQVAADIVSNGGEAYAHAADVTQEQSIQEMIGAALGYWGRLDILVNNAGITADGPFLRLTAAQWHAVLETNLTGVFLCCRRVVPIMREQRYGRIVNISSLAGITGNMGQANYAASKAALVGFSRSLAREVALDNITVNAVAPGYIVTEMVETVTPALRELALKSIAMQRFGTPEEVAAGVAFLVSPRASYVTGHVLVLDGGWAMP